MFEVEVSAQAKRVLAQLDAITRTRALFVLEELAKCAARIVPGSDGWRGLFGAQAGRTLTLDVGRVEASFDVQREERRIKLKRVGKTKSGAAQLPLWRAVAAQWAAVST